MSRESYVSTVISELGNELGIDGLDFDDEAQLGLDIGEYAVTLSLTTEPTDVLWIHVGVGDVEEDDREAFGFLLSYGQLLWTGNRMTIAVDEEGRQAFGFTCVSVVALNCSLLLDLLEQTLEAASEVRQRLENRDFGLPSVPV